MPRPHPHPNFDYASPDTTAKTYAPWPVWRDSTRAQVKFQPIPKKLAVRLWHRARAYDRQTRREGRHGGAVGPTALQVLHTLLFDFLNFRNGQLDPSYAAIARKANLCERAVATALKRLKDCRILTWLRRCSESRRDNGQYVLEQDTNAYAVLPDTQWRGHIPPAEPPRPAPGTWGEPQRMPSALEAAQLERASGGDLLAAARVLELERGNHLATALAALARRMAATET